MENNQSTEIWAYVDLRNHRLFNISLNVIAAARKLSEPLSGKAVAIIPNYASFESIENITETCLSNGSDKVYLIESPDLQQPRPDIHALTLTQMIKNRSPRAVLFALTDFGRETAAISACACNAGMIADCVDLRVEDDRIVADCPSWGGEIMARLTFSNHSDTGFLTVHPHAFQPVSVHGVPGNVESITFDNLDTDDRLELLSPSEESLDRRSLEDAEIVVAGGAGLGNADGFGLARNLSIALGAELGATRPPVLNHWVDEERLIGQTGKTVRPDLLISIGTSGAIQYTAGIMESKKIIAINRDPNSPIFNIADVGIIADAKSLLPPLILRVKQEVMRDIADTLAKDQPTSTGNGLGEKVKNLRDSHKWSMEDLAQRTGHTPEFIQQVEANEVVPPVSFLLRLSKALDVDPGTFLTDGEKAAIQDQRAQAFIKRTKNYYYQTLTPGAENQHLRGFMITIEPKQAHKPVAYKHEGEEFIYVMEGSLELTLDNKVKHLKVGESIHYNSEIPHKLKNLGNDVTKCLVILYTP